MNKTKHLLPIVLLLILSITLSSFAAYRSPAWSKRQMAATPHPAATNAALEILDQGGNAVDALVAAAFALAVVEPYHSGLGGGEFTLLWLKSQGEVLALDARESAPAAATPEMYLDTETGAVQSKKSWQGGLAVGVPGSVVGRVELIKKYGKLSLKKVIDPAYRLAKDGFVIDRILADRIQGKSEQMAENAALAKVFLVDNKPLTRGQILVQPKLARTLELIAKDQGNSFYHGAQAQQIANSCQLAGGILTAQDLADYKMVWRKPIQFNYRGFEIYSMPPPSSGGVCLAEIFNILEEFPLGYVQQGSAEAIHLLASAFELSFADRAKWLGDPDYTPLPVEELISKTYAKGLSQKITRDHRTPVKEAGDPWIVDLNSNTSHLSVIDKWGNMCSMTTSVNSAFGSMVYVPELGFFLNSTMDDFAIAPKAPNKYELVGSQVNSVEPGKRPLSSMSPTLVFKDESPYICTGSVGGPRIITSVAQILINVIDYKMNIQAALDAPRIHMQWQPDKLYLEPEHAVEVVSKLRQWGWIVQQSGHWSLSQGVILDVETGVYTGASDARGVGTAGPADDQ